MADEDMWEKAGFLSPKEAQDWASRQVSDSERMHALRAKSATEIARAYANGELTPEQANDRMFQHEERFGEAIPGTHAFPGTTDEQLLASIDKVRGPYTPASEMHARFEARFGKRGERGGPPKR